MTTATPAEAVIPGIYPPGEVLFATKPQLASALLDRAHRLGIRAAFVAGDEVYGGRELAGASASARWAM